jgi:hypothetical protein
LSWRKSAGEGEAGARLDQSERAILTETVNGASACGCRLVSGQAEAPSMAYCTNPEALAFSINTLM